MISILLVEDHAIFAHVLVRLMARTKKMEISKIATSAEAALQELPGGDFDLALVDVSLPGMNGISLVGLLHTQYPTLPCLMLSGHTPAHYVQRALQAGARGYVLKDDGLAILDAIQRVLKGDVYVSKELGGRG